MDYNFMPQIREGQWHLPENIYIEKQIFNEDAIDHSYIGFISIKNMLRCAENIRDARRDSNEMGIWHFY